MKRDEEIILSGHFYVEEMTSCIHACSVPPLRGTSIQDSQMLRVEIKNKKSECLQKFTKFY